MNVFSILFFGQFLMDHFNTFSVIFVCDSLTWWTIYLLLFSLLFRLAQLILLTVSSCPPWCPNTWYMTKYWVLRKLQFVYNPDSSTNATVWNKIGFIHSCLSSLQISGISWPSARMRTWRGETERNVVIPFFTSLGRFTAVSCGTGATRTIDELYHHPRQWPVPFPLNEEGFTSHCCENTLRI